jgi:hypothetical protein
MKVAFCPTFFSRFVRCYSNSPLPLAYAFRWNHERGAGNNLHSPGNVCSYNCNSHGALQFHVLGMELTGRANI